VPSAPPTEPGAASGDPRLGAVDALAASLVERARPLRLDVAREQAEREQLFRLRCRAVVERRWAAPDAFPDGLEREPVDERAVHVGAWRGGEAVAAARLIFPEPGRRLPVEELFELELEPAGAVVQVDRVTVARAESDRSHRLLATLMARCWLELRAAGFALGVGIDSPAMLRLYRRLGFTTSVLAPPRAYWGEERVPVLFDPAEASDALWARLGGAAGAGR